MRGNLVSRVRSLATALVAGGALLAVAGLAVASWDGTQEINLGDKIGAEFAVGDAFHHEFSFYAPKDTVLNVKAKAATGLTLDFKLYNQLDAEQPLAETVSAAGIKNFKILADGAYTLHVSAKAGAGMYTLTTAGKFPTKVALTAVNADPVFGAMKGAVASASVKPSKTNPGAATITALKYPGGTVASITAGVASFKGIALPVSNRYTLDLTYGTPGSVDVSVGLKTKIAKRTWSFGICTVPTGTPVGIRADWLASPHNDASSEAFRHWDSAGAVDTGCAKCHSSAGYQDWLGADGSAFEVVNAAAPVNTTVDCNACHNLEATKLGTVLFPSGDRVSGLGAEAICMQCHQGRESTVSMDVMINASALADDDVATGGVPSGSTGAAGKLSFRNVHYLAAAATLEGREARGGYQYSGKSYNGLLEHVDDYRTCIQCHDQHSTELRLTECAQCHTGVTDYASLKNIRMERSVADYDGDGDVTEGMAGELKGLSDVLYGAIQAYGIAKGTPIAYDPAAYPYWFNDVTPRTSFTAWTPRLVRAAYNLQYYVKDPGAYAHNSRYVMQLLYDSIASINEVDPVPNFSALVRGDTGHFDAIGMPWRDWDKAEGDSDGLVNINCAQCHSTDGFVLYATTVTSSTELSIVPPQAANEGLRCESCHENGPATFSQAVPPVRYIPAVWFASTKVGGTTKLTNGSKTLGEDANNNGVLDAKEDLDGDGLLDKKFDPSFTCMTCHQGRNSKQTMDDYLLVQNTAPKPSSSSFQNVHYLGAAGTLYGTKAQVGYEYAGMTYGSNFTHRDAGGFGPSTGEGNQCNFCHLADHTFQVKMQPACQVCHGSAGTDPSAIRTNRPVDYNVNGNATEHLSLEVKSFADALLSSIRAYSLTLGATKGIYYDGSANPYWFLDTDGDGIKNNRGEDHQSIAGHLDWDDNNKLDTEDANANGTLDAGEDTNANGILDKEDANANKVLDSDWTSYPYWKDDVQNATAANQGRMLKAAYNYQIWAKDPGAWAHNTKYIIELLYDANDHVGDGLLNGNVATLPGGSAPPARP